MCDADQPPVLDETQRFQSRLSVVGDQSRNRNWRGARLAVEVLLAPRRPQAVAAQSAVGVELHAGDATREIGLCDSASSASGL